MTHVISGPFPIKPETACRTSPSTPATNTAWGIFRIFLVNDCRVAPAPVRKILDRCTMTARSWVDLLPKSMFSKLRSNAVKVRFSQFRQWESFNAGCERFDTTKNFIVPDPTITELNSSGRVFRFRSNVGDGIDFRCRLLQAQHWVLDRVRFRVQTRIRRRRCGTHLFSVSVPANHWLVRFFPSCTVHHLDQEQQECVDDERWGTAANERANIRPKPVPQEPMVRASYLASHYPSL